MEHHIHGGLSQGIGGIVEVSCVCWNLYLDFANADGEVLSRNEIDITRVCFRNISKSNDVLVVGKAL
jgi:hypothetical protein